MIDDLKKLRNIGISAHIDSGKTTLTERILFYTKRIHRIQEVKDKDGGGATMDHMELERERGITITVGGHLLRAGTATTSTSSTRPGHVDFTIEVERALRVLDGAILVLCGVAGVQSQSLTVDRQMRRYKVPRIAFINKLDRSGANPRKVVEQLREKLKHNAVLMQIPIGLEAKFEGVVDLVTMKAVRFEGDNGENRVEAEIPAELRDEAAAAREELLDAVSMFSDELTEAILEERVTRGADPRGRAPRHPLPRADAGLHRLRLQEQGRPDSCSTRWSHYLPSPLDVENTALDLQQRRGRRWRC